MSNQPSLSKSRKAMPQPVVSNKYLLLSFPPNTVTAFSPASLATLVKENPGGFSSEIEASRTVSKSNEVKRKIRSSKKPLRIADFGLRIFIHPLHDALYARFGQ